MKPKHYFHMLLSSILLSTFCSSYAQQVNLSVPQFEKAIAQSNVQVLDVRTADEYKAGHIKNVLLADWNNETEFQERVKSLDKRKPVYTYCLSGGRSGEATKWLVKNGFTAYNLAGGINAWRNADKPIQQDVVVEQITLQKYFADIPKAKTVLIDFSAEWCPPCKKMAPVLDSLVATNGTKFILQKIDGGQQTSLCKQLKVTGFPSFIIYKNGKEVWRKRGLISAKELMQHL